MKISIEVEEVDIGNAEDRVYALVAERIKQTLEPSIYEKARCEIDSTVAKMIEARLVEEIERVIAEGWTPTSSYGEPRGGKVKKAVDHEFGEAIKEAKAQFKAAIDEEVGKRLAEAVKTVLVR